MAGKQELYAERQAQSAATLNRVLAVFTSATVICVRQSLLSGHQRLLTDSL
jgi:hypothetical protein